MGGSSGGGASWAHPFAVGSLWAGSNKGETELRLPLRLFFGFVKFCFCCLAGLWLPFVTGVVLCCVVVAVSVVFCVVLLLLLLCVVVVFVLCSC